MATRIIWVSHRESSRGLEHSGTLPRGVMSRDNTWAVLSRRGRLGADHPRILSDTHLQNSRIFNFSLTADSA
jgi:hypothetical protein